MMQDNSKLHNPGTIHIPLSPLFGCSTCLLLLLPWLQCRAGLIWSGLQVGRFALSPQRLFYHLENDALTHRGVAVAVCV
jgi:hypothetical protein